MKRLVLIMLFLGMMFSFQFVHAQALTSAKLYLKLGQYEKAEASAVRAAEKDPEDEEAWFVLGQSRFALKKYPEMLDAFDKAIALDPEEHKIDIEDFRLKGWAVSHNDGVKYYNSGRDTASYFDLAIAALKTGVRAAPESTQTYFVYALAHYGKKEIAEAIKILNASLEKKPNQQSELDLLAKLYSQLAQEKAAAKDSVGSKENYLASAAAFEKLLVLDRTNADYSLSLIDLYELLGMQDKALAMTRDAVTADPNNRTLRYAYGVYLLKQEKTPEAIEQFAVVESQKADTVDLIHTNSLYNLGVAYLNWGVALKKDSDQKADEAVKAKKKGFKEDMTYKEKFKSAVAYFEKSAELKKDDPFIWQQLGRLYANLNMPKEAEAAYKKYDELNK
ncbi:MAG: tetratricopeptide repeat protein [Bacteroidota bacterium]